MFITANSPRAELEAAAIEAGISAAQMSDADLFEAIAAWIEAGDECGYDNAKVIQARVYG